MSDNDRIIGWEAGSAAAIEGKPIADALIPVPEGIEHSDDYREGVRNGYAEYTESENPFATGASELPDIVGGYDLFAVMDDGDVLCEPCVIDPNNPVRDQRKTNPHDGGYDGWGVIDFDFTGNCDADSVNCAHCSRVIHEGESE